MLLLLWRRLPHRGEQLLGLARPFYRVTGADVSQLNHDLVALGYASRADIEALGWDYYSWDTAHAVRQLFERQSAWRASNEWSR
jgi:hypothetical protein